MSGDLILNLKRNHGIDPNADIYMSRTTKDGRSVLVKTRDLEKSLLKADQKI
ncbi:hypothetical protein CHS0354_002810 [Potamilus streckersoni]|uniref:Uncharacterized protein n=1 Tax=Potamilus streckersoni TaxID=2493646 RepID=A0AAE0VGU6_9BIVA|nr:hypothetical protein CHS0354_002810 [Potamilus streckersoni]